ncbi:TonB-dependent receptor [Desulfoplanes sp.]
MRFFHFFLVVLLFLCASPALADNATSAGNATTSGHVFEMDEYVVTGTRTKSQIKNIPRNVTVITAEDIEHSTAGDLPELLGREAGVQLSDNTGVPGRAKIDIRGQGGAAATNVLVLVDGHRINSVDMSGTNFSTISLSQIERVEVLRGPGGALYGNNAVGGVINIITKSGRGEKFGGQAGAEFGSYDAKKYHAGIRGSKDIMSMSANLSYSDTDGYRDNGGMETKDAQFNFGLDPTDIFSMNFGVGIHEEDYGMPGGVSLADIDDRNKRRETSSPDDHGTISQQRLWTDGSLDLQEYGAVEAELGLLHRENPYHAWGSDQEIKEQTTDYSLTWDKKYTLFEREHRIQAGVEGFYSDYTSYSDIKSFALDTGVFLATTWSLTDDLMLSLGGRYTEYDLDRSSNNNKNWNNLSYDTGLVYSLGDMGSVYTSMSTGFRTPNTDELGLADDDIKPQTTTNYEIGTHLKPMEKIAFDVALFRQESKDEIYYDGNKKLNTNWDQKTLRHGVEAGVKYYPITPLTLWANYTWIKAEFADSHNTVPLVAEHTVNAGIDWRFIEQALLSVSAQYVGSKYDGGDETNDQYEKIDPYTVVDAKLSWDYSKNLNFYCGVNNIFDELYATTATSYPWASAYYVMPERNFYAGLEWKF